MGSARLLNSGLVRNVKSSGNVDAVHYPVTVPIPAFPDLPSVVTIHDTQHLDMPWLFSRAERLFRRWAYDETATRADAIITDSRFSAESICRNYQVVPERVYVIHCGIDHTEFNTSNRHAIDRSLPERFIYYPANKWRHKNHRGLIEALDRLENRDVVLVLTGRSMPGGESLPSHDRVLDLGHVSRRQVAGLYRQAEATVFPSLYEGFGFPPLEAMASGCPVAAANIPTLEEVCGEAALMFDPRDPDSIATAIDQILSDSELRGKLVDQGIRHATSFTWERAARKHNRVYREVGGLDR